MRSVKAVRCSLYGEVCLPERIRYKDNEYTAGYKFTYSARVALAQPERPNAALEKNKISQLMKLIPPMNNHVS